MDVDLKNGSTIKTLEQDNNLALLQCIRNTQMQLGKHVSHPPLLLKYLVQPPFLFFHDIITSVIKTKGFLRGLFTADELDRIKTRSLKENRINFLDKLVKALHATTGERFPKFNLAKMSTGRHPLSVNRLLHSIAYALDKNMNSDLAVRKVIGGLLPDLCDRGSKRKQGDNDEDDYFGDDESENQQSGKEAPLKKKFTVINQIPMGNAAVLEDEDISQSYETDMETFNCSGASSLHDIQPNKIAGAFSNLSIYDDSGMEE